MTVVDDRISGSAARRPDAALPPLVEPGPALTRAQLERYSRHVILPDVGDVGQRRLTNAKVAVIGAGGLGSPVLTYLAAAGVGTLGIVDFDVVEMSNLQRQTIHGVSDVGRAKTASAVDALAEINPDVTVRTHELRLTAANALETLTGYDLVIDGTDNFATRYLVNDACVLLGVPYVWGSVFRFEGQVSVFWAEHGPQYRELFPCPPPAGSVPSCGEGGVLGVVCAAVGAVMATEAVKLLCGVGRPLVGRVLVYDALAMSFRTVAVRKDPDAAPISGLIDYDAFCAAPTADRSRDSRQHPELSAAELAELLESGDSVTVVDVREPAEFALGAIPGALSIPLADVDSNPSLDVVRAGLASGHVVLYCKAGTRSSLALDRLEQQGVVGVRHLSGGILTWMSDVDTTLPRY